MMMYIWIALTAAFGVAEALTTQLVSIWFVIGSITALGSYFLGASEVTQIVVFVIVSAVALIATRPLVRKYTKAHFDPTNADSNIGLDAVVTEEINNVMSKGAVRVKGIEWTARSRNSDSIPKGEIVTVKAIEGVKLIVDKK